METLFYTADQPQAAAEAARVMGKKSKQVDNLLYRAKRELQGILGEEGMELL